MALTKQTKPKFAGAYDREEVRVYLKKRGGWFISWDEVVKTDTIKNELILDIKTEDIPDKILFNGKQVKLIEEKI